MTFLVFVLQAAAFALAGGAVGYLILRNNPKVKAALDEKVNSTATRRGW